MELCLAPSEPEYEMEAFTSSKSGFLYVFLIHLASLGSRYICYLMTWKPSMISKLGILVAISLFSDYVPT